LFRISLVGGRDLLVGAESPRARSAWITAIIATKTHGELVSKAWSALGGDCAAEVVQLMSLANDWEDLILAGVGLDYVPEKSTLGLRASQRRLLGRGGMDAPPMEPTLSTPAASFSIPSAEASFAVSSPMPDAAGGEEGGGGGGGSGGGGEEALSPLVARALSGESGGVKERIANRVRGEHAAGIEHRISAKVRMVLEREEKKLAAKQAATATTTTTPTTSNSGKT
jgi:hypothetical protein